MVRKSFASLGACLLLTLCSCGSSADSPAQPAPGGGATGAAPSALPALPAPLQLKPRQASAAISVLDAGDFDQALANNVLADSADAVFEPSYYPPASSVAGLAYAVYELAPDIANDAPLLHLAWREAPAAGRCWIGLGNFTSNRWEWLPWTAGQDVPLDLSGRHVSGQGRVYAVVLLLGGDVSTLGRVRIGTNQPPVASIDINRPYTPLPYNIALLPAGSADPDGIIASYEYDVDGDGTFDQTYDSPGGAFEAVQDGSFLLHLHVTDDEGATADAYLPWDTGYSDYWFISQDLYHAYFFDACASSENGFYYACGKAKTDSNFFDDALLVRYDAQGSVVWSRTLRLDKSEVFNAVLPAPGGGAFVAGTSDTGFGDGCTIIARYNADGTLAWQRRWGNPDSFRDIRMVADYTNDRLYVSTMLDMAGLSYNAALLRLGMDGSFAWANTYGGTGVDEGRGVALDSSGNPVLLVQTDYMAANGYDFALIKFNPQGTQLAKVQYDSGYNEEVCALAGNYIDRLAIMGEARDANVDGPAIWVVDHDLAPVRATLLAGGMNTEENFSDGGIGFDGTVWACGTKLDAQNFNDGAICCWRPDGSLKLWLNGPDGVHNQLAGMGQLENGCFLLAGYSPANFQDWKPWAGTGLSLTPATTIPALNAQQSLLAPQITTGTVHEIQPLQGNGADYAQLMHFWEPREDS